MRLKHSLWNDSSALELLRQYNCSFEDEVMTEISEGKEGRTTAHPAHSHSTHTTTRNHIHTAHPAHSHSTHNTTTLHIQLNHKPLTQDNQHNHTAHPSNSFIMQNKQLTKNIKFTHHIYAPFSSRKKVPQHI